MIEHKRAIGGTLPILAIAWCASVRADLIHQWTFNDGTADDAIGEAHGFLEGDGIEIRDGRLALGGSPGSRMLTAPLGEFLEAKTLVAWASPAILGQRGGSILTVENGPNGDVFDAIVAFERVPGQWMAGSNGFTRTVPDNGGFVEDLTCPDQVMIAIVYDVDGTIAIYRDDELYADPVLATQGFLQTFDEFSVAQIGARHGSHPDVFQGFVDEARIYSTALDAGEIADIFDEGPQDFAPLTAEDCEGTDLCADVLADGELVHRWTFNGDADDDIGGAHGTLSGGASIVAGRLSLDGIQGSQMVSLPLGEALCAKTLVAWCSPGNLQQQGGSILTVETPDFSVFDAIVAFERVPGQWMAGSNFFLRTVPDNLGPSETSACPEEIMLAIVYDDESGITVYRDGELYAGPDVASQGVLQTFGDDAIVQIGPRHGPNTAVFDGFVNEARIYRGALDAGAIAAIHDAGPEGPDGPLTAEDCEGVVSVPELRHQWTFNGAPSDQIGDAHGTLEGGATIEGDENEGRLALDGIAGTRMITRPLGGALGEKTLVAWVSPNQLAQRGGSILTVESDRGGAVFDAIVAFERIEGQWMAGSNGFARTVPDNGGPFETVTEPDQVMLAIVYDRFHQITIYRDDELYAPPEFASQGVLQSFAATAVAQIGARHGQHPDVFDGFVDEARIYSGALTEDDITQLFEEGPSQEPAREIPPPPAPELRHQWTFNEGGLDLVGEAHGTLEGGAFIEDGRLSIDGFAGSRFITGALGASLGAKTLVAWASPTDLFQQGGSILTVENSPAGDIFDAIVAFERVPGQWMAGSNGFARSVPDNFGPPETITEPDQVMIAIVYGDDDSITIWRDDELYAGPESASQGALQLFDENAVAQIGSRHGTLTAAFAGFVDEARIYSGALDEDAIIEIFEAGPCEDDADCFGEPPVGTPFVRGDVDASGAVNITDGIFVLNFLFLGGAAPPCREASDADASDAINITDGIFVLNFLFLGGAAPPAPYPACGVVEGAECAAFAACE